MVQLLSFLNTEIFHQIDIAVTTQKEMVSTRSIIPTPKLLPAIMQ